MAVIIGMFFVIFVLALMIFGILVTVINNKPNSARYIELIGYAFLIISLIWTGVTNLTNDSSSSTDKIMLEEKMHVLWSFEKDKLDYLTDEDINDLYEDYRALYDYINGPISDVELIKEQDKIAKNINYGLFVLSTLFIAAGRLEELLKRGKKEKDSNY